MNSMSQFWNKIKKKKIKKNSNKWQNNYYVKMFCYFFIHSFTYNKFCIHTYCTYIHMYYCTWDVNCEKSNQPLKSLLLPFCMHINTFACTYICMFEYSTVNDTIAYGFSLHIFTSVGYSVLNIEN